MQLRSIASMYVFHLIQGWFSKLLGEEVWRFEINRNPDVFWISLSSRIERVTKLKFWSPIDTRSKKKAIGYWDDDSIVLKVNRSTMRARPLMFFGGGTYYFFGNHLKQNNSNILEGIYRRHPGTRLFNIISSVFVFIFMIVCFFLSLYFVLIELNLAMSIRSALIGLAGLPLLIVHYITVKVSQFFDKPLKKQLFVFLSDLTAEGDQS